ALTVAGGTTTLPSGASLSPAVLTLGGGTLNVEGAGTTTLPRVDLTGGTFGGSRPRTIGTLNAQGGTLGGAPTTLVARALTKSTAGQLMLTGGITLRPQIDTTWSAGDICIQGGSTLRVEHLLTVAAGAGGFNCTDATSLVFVTQTGAIQAAGGPRNWFSR